MIFKDVTTFSREEIFNAHGFHVYVTYYPHATRPHVYERFCVNVWVGIVNGFLFGHTYVTRLNGVSYLFSLKQVMS